MGWVALLVLCLLGPGRAAGVAGEADIEEQQSTARHSRQGRVQLRSGGAELIGLATEPLVAVKKLPEIQGIAEVLDLQPLLSLRAEYRAAQSEESIAGAALRASTHEFERVAHLYKEGAAISHRQVQEAESRLHIDRAKRDSALQRQRSVREKGIQQWGVALVSLALNADSPQFDQLIERSAVVLLVTFDAQAKLPRPLQTLFVGREGARAEAQAVAAIWPAPITSQVTQGESYYVLGPVGSLRTGMRISAWTPNAASALQGVEIKADAIVWLAGEPWVYVVEGPESFQRRAIGKHFASAGGWLVPEGFTAGERVVIHGGQTLLSEEQRQLLPDD